MKKVIALAMLCSAISFPIFRTGDEAKIYADIQQNLCWQASYNFSLLTTSNQTFLISTVQGTPCFVGVQINVQNSTGSCSYDIKWIEAVNFSNSTFTSNSYYVGSVSNSQIALIADLFNLNRKIQSPMPQTPAVVQMKIADRIGWTQLSSNGYIAQVYTVNVTPYTGNRDQFFPAPYLVDVKKYYMISISNSATNTSTFNVQIQIKK